ncbi:FAD-dependent oxidoreductase [Paraburkholderia sp. 22B1P]|uniref:FAD-dependent oxidoreductase n=1 Tax=Paraburkholderia sp. 22B1P TaxID=3080498 RepID=UPI00308F52BE|nr:FAD-dependent oxidoreductase [Paraburkholderia sp. 22B1P]
MILTLVERAQTVGAKIRATTMPWLLLISRVWFAQVFFVHQIMAMAYSHALPTTVLYVPSSLEAALRTIAPLLLTIGLSTRPVSFVVLCLSYSHGLSGVGVNPEGARLVLLAWLTVFGAGPFSLDALLQRGLPWVPFGLVRITRRVFGWIETYFEPHFLLLVRFAISASVFAAISPTLFGSANAAAAGPYAYWVLIVVGYLMAMGFMARTSTLVCAAMLPLMSNATSMDDRLAILLPLLLVASAGPGAFSIDALIARLARARIATDPGADENQRPHVIVVGGGFAGVATVRGLRNERCSVTLIDQHNHHLFQPLLYQVATAALSAGEIATPIRSLFRTQRNVQVRLGEVTDIDMVSREVKFGNSRLGFDYLVLATGARHSYFGKDDWAPFAPGLKSINDATDIRSRLLRAFEEAENAQSEADRDAWLTFVIVGGGPTGIELAGAIAELARHGLEMEYRLINPSEARVLLLQAGPRLLPTFPAQLSDAAERSLRMLGVEVFLEARVTAVDEMGVEVSGRRIAARTALWAAGVTASPAARWLARPADRSGRLIVGADLSVPDLDEVYAVGDTALSSGWNGDPVPGLAPAAKQQGQYVARVIGARLSGREPPPPFRYRHFGSLATIGRQAAVADVRGIRVWGAPAWWFWGVAHIAFLAGGRNRLAVIFDWLWAYLTYRHSSRLITTGSPETKI